VFEWNDKKKKRNREEHGLHFEDAELVFSDSDRITTVMNASITAKNVSSRWGFWKLGL